MGENDLLARLAADDRVGVGREVLEALLASDERFIGAALGQADAVLAEIDTLAEKVPGAREYRPGAIL